jgi:hypothetical protein
MTNHNPDAWVLGPVPGLVPGRGGIFGGRFETWSRSAGVVCCRGERMTHGLDQAAVNPANGPRSGGPNASGGIGWVCERTVLRYGENR